MDTLTIKLQENEYFNIDVSNEKDIYFINGGRGVGKSFFVKEYVKQIVKKGRKFMYVRGKRDELATIHTWLQETNLHNTFGFDGEFVRGIPFANAISFRPLEKNKDDFIEHIGYSVSLESSTFLKSGFYNDVDVIIFEEYSRFNQTYNKELEQTNNFIELIETVARERKIKIFCISNNIKAISPLEEIFKDASNAVKYKVFNKNKKRGVLSGVKSNYLGYLQGEQLENEYVNLNEYFYIYNIKMLGEDLGIYKHKYLNEFAFNLEKNRKIFDKLELLNCSFKFRDRLLNFSNYKTEIFVRKNIELLLKLINKEVY